jgi:hypothetical protein
MHAGHCSDGHNPGMDYSSLRYEIAAAAAAMIAEDGLDYANAKRRAFERITGGKGSKIAREMLPSNEEVEEAVREHQAIFQSEEQPKRLSELRHKALALMGLLSDFSPMVTGAIANGTASEHSDIHLHCFADSAKELGIFLLNHNLRSEAGLLPNVRPEQPDVEALAIQWQGELATIAVYPELELRLGSQSHAKKKVLRLSATALKALLNQPSNGNSQ